MNRILWNRRPKDDADPGDIDEIVIHNATVHIEQMTDRCWWIGIDLDTDHGWAGNFTFHHRKMHFEQQESEITWDRDDCHEALK